jgi:hypothetical protein
MFVQNEPSNPFASWPKEGCTLAEARDLFAKKLWDAIAKVDAEKQVWLRLEAMLPQSDLIARETFRRVTLPLMLRQLETKSEAAHQAFVIAFAKPFLNGDLIAMGRFGGPWEPITTIHTSKWERLGVFSWEKSSLEDVAQPQMQWHDVRIYAAGRRPARLAEPHSDRQMFHVNNMASDPLPPTTIGRTRDPRPRKRPVGDLVAALLKKHGLDKDRKGLSNTEIAHKIRKDMPRHAETADAIEALATAVKRHFERLKA